MFKMLTQLFTTVSVFFGAIEKFARAFDHLGTFTEESSGAFADQARIDREKKYATLNAGVIANAKRLAEKANRTSSVSSSSSTPAKRTRTKKPVV